MKTIFFYSILLALGLIGSQLLEGRGQDLIKIGTMFCLAYIMIHVGYEFDIDKSRLSSYVWDYLIAGTAALFPWIFCAGYFIWVIGMESWKEALLLARFSSPTSAGVLFSMLAAAGLAATWVFRKARVLAIFDDLDTILLMIPLKIMTVGINPQAGIVICIIVFLLWMAWRFLHSLQFPARWPFVMLYAAVITAVCEGVYFASSRVEDTVPIELEVLLPAFVLGCILARPPGSNPHSDDPREGHSEGPEDALEQKVSGYITMAFMLLVGLSMPVIPREGADASVIAGHVILITLLSNIGKTVPIFCYRKEATLRERLALSVAMFPRGEVGAGVLVVSIGYGLGGTALTVAVLSLIVNLLMTGLFILVVKKLITHESLHPKHVY